MPPLHTPLYDHFAATAARAPAAPALDTGTLQLSHGQLLALADATAADLQRQGLGAGSLVGWLGHNSPELLATLLACARLGAVFVPLNWRLAAPELQAIARHAGLQCLLHTPECQALADAVRAGVSLIPGPDGSTRPGDVLLVYTSGTTGSPKGAMHTQQGMLANIAVAQQVQGLGAATRTLAVLPLFHVGGLCIQLLPTLAAGGVVRLPARFDPAAWLADVAQWRPHTSLLVPAVMQAILAQPGFAEADLSALQFLNSGSSIVPVPLIQAFQARGVPVAQVYGSTETGPFSIALTPAQAPQHIGSVGWPAPGVQLLLAGADDRPVAPGQVGEIRLKAPNLMRGYHRQPAQGPGSGFIDGWFATGDLGQASPADGCITVVGRSKDMLISGGENIYPAEIEMLASAWPGVADAVVLGLPDARWGEVPVLVLQPQAGAAVDLDGLRAHLATQLARFKQPRQVLLREALPRTALGKVQKAALREALLAAPAEPAGPPGPPGPRSSA